MGITVQWENDAKTIARYVFNGQWSFNEVQAAVNQANELMDSVDHKVAMIADLRDSSFTPDGILAQLRQSAMSDTPHRNYAGVTVLVGVGTIAKMMINAAVKLVNPLNNQHTILFANTVDEARDTIARTNGGNPQP